MSHELCHFDLSCALCEVVFCDCHLNVSDDVYLDDMIFCSNDCKEEHLRRVSI